MDIGLFAGLILVQVNLVNMVTLIEKSFSSFFLIVLLPPILYENAINMNTVRP